ncbi:MAG: NACHT domain-containing protein [Cyanosarcina radialis HA8281-LM2]|jgi:predicted transcriptional regulator/DNA replication protein DnaC|nr:NACHT domain-containing protein [Cyanosarcina radialis HA8281-LM2]
MDYKEALNVVKSAVAAKTEKQLSEAEKTVLRGAWEGKTYDEMTVTSGYTLNYLKNDAGPNFWKLLSEVFGEKVSKANLRAILERHSRYQLERLRQKIEQTREQARATCKEKGATSKECAVLWDAMEEMQAEIAHKNSKKRLDWGEAPLLPTFYGRTNELEKLKKWILQDKDPLVILLGIGGIGKTTLAVKLVEEIQGEFEYVIWRSLRSPSPPLADLLADIINFFSQQQRTNLPETVEGKLSLLMERLRQHRCLLILDNAESLMQGDKFAGTYQTGYEDYRELWRRVGTERHKSCLLLTSRENTKQLVELSAQGFPVRLLAMPGLESKAAYQLLAAKGLADRSSWEDLIAIYQGNPLALQIATATIQRSFGGKVSEFLQQRGIEMAQIFDLVDRQFHNLSDLEQKVMYWLTISRQPMSFAELQESIEISGAELLEAIESLLRRSLVQGEADFQLNPIVQQYTAHELDRQQIPLTELPDNKDDIRQALERIFDRS